MKKVIEETKKLFILIITALLLTACGGGAEFADSSKLDRAAEPVATTVLVQFPTPQIDDEEKVSPHSAVDGWAVLAEKDDYSDVEMTNLLVDYINIEQMRQLLLDFGWQEDHILDLREFDRAELRDALDWLAEHADDDDTVLLYVTAHGMFLRNVIRWNDFFADDWAEIPSPRRVLLVDACQAALWTGAVTGDTRPHLSIAAVDTDEYSWSGLEEEGLPIIGGVFTHYFAEAFTGAQADADGNGAVSVQEAALWAEGQQRTYMHETVFAVPEFVEGYHNIGVYPDEDPEFPDVVLDDTIGAPIYLELAEMGDAPASSDKEANLRITIIYDNVAYDARLRADWGFAALIEYDGQTLLFDTGADPEIFMRNLALLEIDPITIDAVMLSHIHGDHTGGLRALLETGIQPPAYVPPSFPPSYKEKIGKLTNVTETAPGQMILDGMFTTGEMPSRAAAEQGLVIKTARGIVVITGCAHPGIVNMITRAKELFDAPLRLVLGGFHLEGMNAGMIDVILNDFRELGVEKVAPAHCTGAKTIEMFAEEYGEDYIEAGAGRVIVID